MSLPSPHDGPDDEPVGPAPSAADVHVVRGAPDEVELAALVAGLVATAHPDDEAPAPATEASKAGIGFEGGLESPGAGGAAAPASTGMGGIALGMTECEAVRRAGTPSNVAISSGAGGQRRVVLTYLSGTWPGIYTFTGGRLKEIDAAPEQSKPKAPPKKRKVKRAKSAHSSSTEREYVR